MYVYYWKLLVEKNEINSESVFDNVCLEVLIIERPHINVSVTDGDKWELILTYSEGY